MVDLKLFYSSSRLAEIEEITSGKQYITYLLRVGVQMARRSRLPDIGDEVPAELSAVIGDAVENRRGRLSNFRTGMEVTEVRAVETERGKRVGKAGDWVGVRETERLID